VFYADKGMPEYTEFRLLPDKTRLEGLFFFSAQPWGRIAVRIPQNRQQLNTWCRRIHIVFYFVFLNKNKIKNYMCSTVRKRLTRRREDDP
jgi:hypothetical protein